MTEPEPEREELKPERAMNNDRILGIENRTENSKTVQHFHGLTRKGKVSLVRGLLGNQEIGDDLDIKINLFWYGFRDYIAQCNEEEKPTKEQVGKIYGDIFGDLQNHVSGFQAQEHPRSFAGLQPHNYSSAEDFFQELFENLGHTEIDIVIQCGKQLLLGEAKSESSLNTDSRYVLVHQLIRQHVMATVLAQVAGADLEIFHFLVGDADRVQSLRNTVQVKFMIHKGWLKPENVLSWEQVAKLTSGG